MPQICYVPKRFDKDSKRTISKAIIVLEEYARVGIRITLRTLHYQFVARGWMANTLKNYKRLGRIVGEARLAGLIDWDHLSDNIRFLCGLKHYGLPQEALEELAKIYHIDLWEHQKYRPEIWIEKDALVGSIERVCDELDVPYFCCRGYTSLSEMWKASERLKAWIECGYQPHIIHFGDHDPSGIDMSRDIIDRLQTMFTVNGLKFERVALNMDQIRKHKCPPNFAKETDSRFKEYKANFGDKSWELDALNPTEFRNLIEAKIHKLIDRPQWEIDIGRRDKAQVDLLTIAAEYHDVIKRVKDRKKKPPKKLTKPKPKKVKKTPPKPRRKR